MDENVNFGFWCKDCNQMIFDPQEVQQHNSLGHGLIAETREFADILPFGGECGGG